MVRVDCKNAGDIFAVAKGWIKWSCYFFRAVYYKNRSKVQCTVILRGIILEGAEQMEKSELLRQWIADSDNIVFSGEPVCQRRAEYQISEVWTVCIIRNMIIHRRQF